MLIVKFTLKNSMYTWFISDYWVTFFAFLLTMRIGIAYRKSKNSKKKSISSQRGGDFIDNCIDPDSVYELVDPALEIVIKQMLNLPPEAGPVIISVPVLIISHIVARYPVKQITIWGVTVLVNRAKEMGIKVAIGAASGSIFFFMPVGVVSLTGALLAGTIFLNIVQGISNIECDNFVSKVSMERVSEEKNVAFLERPPERNPKVYIKGNEDIPLYSLSSNENESCSSEYKKVEIKKSTLKRGIKTKPQTQIQRECRKKYDRLEKRTKTLDDLKREDSTINREKAEPYIKRYEERRKHIMNNKNKEL